MSDVEELVKRLRDMASAWKRWGADGAFKGALHSDIVNEAADTIDSLRASLTRAEEERDALASEMLSFVEGTLALCRDVRNWPVTPELRSALEDGLVARGHALRARLSPPTQEHALYA